MTRTATTGLGRMKTLAVGVMAVGAVLVTAPAASAGPAVSPTGNFCAYNSATGALACVDAEKDYPAAKEAVGI